MTTTSRDYFLSPFGPKPVGKTTDSKTDLGEIVREIDELAVFNDEAHHIHDPRMAWFGSIHDIHHRMLQKDRRLALQVDVTATPRHNNGAIFVQTVSDYPLVEAIHQNVVKHPVLPDAASRARCRAPERDLSREVADYLRSASRSGEELRAARASGQEGGAVRDGRRHAQLRRRRRVSERSPRAARRVLVIHTKNNGEISEAQRQDQGELETLRREANGIDSWDSPYKASSRC